MSITGAVSSMMAVRLSGFRVAGGAVVWFETFNAAVRSRSRSEDDDKDWL